MDYGGLVHRSLDNKSKTPHFTMVFRFFDYTEDLTLSSNWADIPYARKSFGWPEIKSQADIIPTLPFKTLA